MTWLSRLCSTPKTLSSKPPWHGQTGVGHILQCTLSHIFKTLWHSRQAWIRFCSGHKTLIPIPYVLLNACDQFWDSGVETPLAKEAFHSRHRTFMVS